MGGLIVVIVSIGYCYLTYRVGLAYWQRSKEHTPVQQLIGRAVFLPLFWGVGFVRIEGLELPGPIVPCTFFWIVAPGRYTYEDLISMWLKNFVIIFSLAAVHAFIATYKPGGPSRPPRRHSLLSYIVNFPDRWSNSWLNWGWMVRHSEPDLDEFDALKALILSNSSTDQLPVELNKLRRYLLSNGLDHHYRFRNFYEKWLTHVNVVKGVAAKTYSNDDERRMKYELELIDF
jgi:hypothetical protein